ncbi:hypothetical protein CFB84_25555 [Burkholderia aenigmatica]|uniref:Uncharacterized protein n=1 Tax=Burkholderia aenigmatica TaxID=2015348 RepID=A0A228IBL5_9BURK|nr:hypothetical protein CFB84_25555 [Burkholderia aenigmatica]
MPGDIGRELEFVREPRQWWRCRVSQTMPEGGRPAVARVALRVEFTVDRHRGDAERAEQRLMT